jgi:hypothetical protein
VDLREEDAVSKRRGKWSDPGVPHKGWTCIDVDDLGEASEICAMCEAMQIRYVHTMTHPAYEGSLAVGVVCAGNMAQDLKGALERERLVRNRSARRARFLSRKWRTASTGNRCTKLDGHRLTLWGRGTQWGVTIANEATDVVVRVRGRSEMGAKLAAFDRVTGLGLEDT